MLFNIEDKRNKILNYMYSNAIIFWNVRKKSKNFPLDPITSLNFILNWNSVSFKDACWKCLIFLLQKIKYRVKVLNT